MKLSRREKMLIIVFFVLILIYVGVEVVPTYSLEKSWVKEKHDELFVVYDDMLQDIRMKDFYEGRRQKLQAEISEMDMLSDIKQEKIIEVLYKNLSSYDIKIVNINFSDVLPVDIKTLDNELLTDSGDDSEELCDEQNEGISVLSMLVNVEFKSNYEGALILIDKMQESNVNMAITNIHIIKQDYNNIYGNMEVRFYAISTMY